MSVERVAFFVPKPFYKTLQNNENKINAHSVVSPSAKQRGGQLAFVCLLVACCLEGVSSGFIFTTSYYIAPVERACSLAWPRALTVYATAGMYLSQAILGPVAGFVIRRRADDASSSAEPIVLSLALTGAGFLLCGIPVYFCRDGGALSEGVYFSGFLFLGVANVILFVVVGRSFVLLLPNRLGLAGGLYGLCNCVGSIAFAQLLVVFDESKRIDASTMFFLAGIVSIVISAVAAPAFGRNIHRRAVEYATAKCSLPSKAVPNGRLIHPFPDITCLSLFKTSQCVCLFLGVLTNALAACGILAQLDPMIVSFWGREHTPRSLLSFLSLGAYMIGRVFWTGFSDRIGLILTWRFSLGGASLFLFVLAISEESRQGPLPIALLCIYFLFATAAKVTSTGLGFAFFGMAMGTFVAGLLSVAFGMGAAVGPVLLQVFFQRFGSYQQVLLLYAGLNAFSLVASFFMNCSSRKVTV